MEAGVHEIAANVIFMFVYNGLNTLCGVFILHLLLLFQMSNKTKFLINRIS